MSNNMSCMKQKKDSRKSVKVKNSNIENNPFDMDLRELKTQKVVEEPIFQATTQTYSPNKL